jgi:hypothetical protein
MMHSCGTSVPGLSARPLKKPSLISDILLSGGGERNLFRPGQRGPEAVRERRRQGGRSRQLNGESCRCRPTQSPGVRSRTKPDEPAGTGSCLHHLGPVFGERFREGHTLFKYNEGHLPSPITEINEIVPALHAGYSYANGVFDKMGITAPTTNEE